jgi:hypothetical protein
MARSTAAVRLLAGDKEPVRLASTGNLALAGLLTVDGAVTVAGDRVLVKDQTDATENGIYTASEGTWYRAPDANADRLLIAGMKVHVQEGTQNAGDVWSLASNRPDLGEDDVEWEFYLSTGIIQEINNVTAEIISTIYSLTGAADFATRSIAEASTLPLGMTYLRTAGQSAVGDLGVSSILFKKLSATPSPVRSWHFQSADTAYWQLKGYRVNPRMFGAIGDGVADDREAFQDAIDFLNTMTGGGTVEGVPGDTYRFVIDSGVTDNGLILQANVDLIGNGAAIHLECTGGVYGIRPLGNNRILGWELATTVSAGLSATLGAEQAIWHSCISIGCAYGDTGTVASPSQFLTVNGIEIAYNSLTSVRNNGQGALIQGYGGMYRVHIHHNIVPDNSTIAMGIGFDWVPLGDLPSSDIALGRTNYDNGDAYSVHPHDIAIEHNIIGRLTMAPYFYGGQFGSHGIRLSGVYNVRLVGNDIAETTYCGIFVTAGDQGFEFAPGSERRLAAKGILIEGNMLRECNTRFGIFYDAYPDNVYDAANNPANPSYPYSPIGIVDGYESYPRIISNTIVATTTAGASAAAGIHTQFLLGGLISSNVVTGFKQCIRAANHSRDVEISRNNVTLAAEEGILAGDTAPSPDNIRIINNRAARNCVNGGTQGNIGINGVTRATVSGNLVGALGEDNCLVGIQVTDNSSATTVERNRVVAVKAGGTAYVFGGSATAYTTVQLARDNTVDAGFVGTVFSGIDIIPIGYDITPTGVARRRFIMARAVFAVVPGSGTWLTGDTIEFIDPVSTGYKGKVCTAGGTPGTWKNWGQLD